MFKEAAAAVDEGLGTETIERFLRAPWRAEGLAESTRKAYAYELAKLAKHLVPGVLQQATEVQLREYLLAMHERGVQAAGVRRATLAMRSYYAWLTAEGSCSSNPAKALDARRPPTTVPRVLGEVRVRALTGLQRDAPLREQLRDRALIEVVAGTNLRLAELLQLKCVHVDLPAGVLNVFGPGGARRTVDLPASAIRALETYLEQGRPAYVRATSPCDYLFLTRLGGQLTSSGLWRQLRTIAGEAGLDPTRVSAEALRRPRAAAEQGPRGGRSKILLG